MMLALAALMLLPTLARADVAADKAKAKDEIWALEQSIYAGPRQRRHVGLHE